MTRSTPKRILILDDDDEMQTMLRLLLTDEGYHVTPVANSPEAILLHQQNPFDLAIIELFMTESNGFDAFAAFRRMTSSPKFIVTAKSIRTPTEDYLKVARQLGAHETLAKPFTADQLLTVVRNVLN